ncbi:MAG: serine/threonine-protein kinase [Gemmatimonadota bacterium]
MTDDLFRRAREVFQASFEVSDEERPALLTELCAGDELLRAEVESLLAYDRDATVAFSVDGVDLSAPLDPAPWLGRRIGPWTIDGIVGRGGMGTVYSAHRTDGTFDQRVAIKTLGLGSLDDRGVERFTLERRFLARLEHPNIARILDGGTAEDGLPYLVMEYVDGVPIHTWCEARGLSIEDRIWLFREVCAAVEHAHSRLVLHRDIKPSNILVTEDGRPKLLDFGVAKALSPEPEEGLTRMGGAPLTPDYAAPEQFKGEPLTTATDVYQLGALLYLLLAGRPPFAGTDGVGALMARVLRDDPMTPGEARRSTRTGTNAPVGSAPGPGPDLPQGARLPRELDDIVMMALRKEPERRYASVAELSGDLGNHLTGLPVRAHGEDRGYRMRKFVQRNRAAVALSVLVIVSLVAGMAATLHQGRRATDQARLARLEARKASAINRFMQETLSSADPFRLGADVGLQEVLRASVGALDTAMAEEPEIRAGLLAAIGQTYVNQGLVDLGLAIADSAVATYARLGQRYSHEAYPAHFARVFGLNRQGRFAELVPTIREIIAGYVATHGASDPTVLALWGPLGHARFQLGEVSEAISGLDSATARAESVLGPDDPTTHVLMAFQGNLLVLESQRVREGIDLARRGAEGLLAGGVRSPLEVDALSAAVGGLARGGEVDTAERIARALLERTEAAFGVGTPATIPPRGMLTVALSAAHRFDEALPLAREAHEDAERLLGPDHLLTDETKGYYATLLAMTGRAEEAEAHQRQVYDAYAARYGEGAPTTLVALQNVAFTVGRLGRMQEARSLLERATELATPSGGLPYYFALTNLLIALGADDPEHALALADERLPQARMELATGSQTLNNLLIAYARVRFLNGDVDGAETTLMEVRANYLEASAGDTTHPNVRYAVQQLITFSQAAGRPAEVARWTAELERNGS